MKIIDAINQADELKPNFFTQEQKIAWLSNIDAMIKKTIIDTHAGWEEVEFNGYEDVPIETELLAESPFDSMYPLWLEAQMDYANSEYAKYNNSVLRFNDIYTNYRNYYNSTHMPLGAHIKYF